jgi:hypothetical protein
MAGTRHLQVAETQTVEQGDGSRTHGEDVAQDAADTGGRSLEWLDSAGVIVALDLHHDGVAIPDIDRAGVLLAGSHEHALALGGETLQKRP